MNIKQIIPVIILGVFILVFACKKEQPQLTNEAKDPCDCASEVSADFTMEEMSTWNFDGAFYTETDSILRNRYVRFTAKQDDAKYTWYLGTETETTQEAFRQFPNSLVGTNQPIILVVKKEPNNFCFPEDDGYDSVVKYLSVTEYPISEIGEQDIDMGPKEGVFKMSLVNDTDSINIILDYARDGLNVPNLNIYNYDGQGSDCVEQADDYFTTYRETRIDGSVTNCNRLRGYIKSPMDGNVEMYFTEFEPEHPDYKEYHYYGRRVGPL